MFVVRFVRSQFARQLTWGAPVAASMVWAMSGAGLAQMPAPKPPVTGPWMNQALSADERATLLVKEMTLDEKIGMVHGNRPFGSVSLASIADEVRWRGGAGFIPGIERLGIPDIQMADAAVGVTRASHYGRYSTALPSPLAASATWNNSLAYDYGALIGKELRAQGFNMSLGGGVNITREPRNGRNFEYQGEDPILAGTLGGQSMKGLQAQHVIGDIKHYAANDQETGRTIVNVLLDERSMRETDLLAFEVGLHESHAAAVMCSYNRVQGDYACENQYLLNDVLKKTWGFQGWVISDWGATHSTAKAAVAGLDQEMPGGKYFGVELKKSIEGGQVPMSRLDDMVHRIVRSEIKSGVFDDPPQSDTPDIFAGLELARKVEEQGIVLLKNRNALLPLEAGKVHRIAVIGSHADVGVLSGGGSAQVDPPGGNAVPPPPTTVTTGVAGSFVARGPVWMPSSPLKALRGALPGSEIVYDSGDDPVVAARVAAAADVVVVFVNQPTSEGRDDTLTLPGKQDALVAAVAAANKHVTVVLETGGPVLMPWADKVDAVVAAWYPGISGGPAIAEILTGAVNPTGKLSVTFPQSIASLPHAEPFGWELLQEQNKQLAGTPQANSIIFMRPPLPNFDGSYSEGLLVGYKWYDAKHKTPLFPFGHGLSYTTYGYEQIKVASTATIDISFTVKNTGKRGGAEISEVYTAMPAAANEPPKRLVGWSRNELQAGESKAVQLSIDPHYFAIFNTEKKSWEIVEGKYEILVGGSTDDLPLHQTVYLQHAFLAPLSAE